MNRLVLCASLAQVAALRYTPAGIPVLDMRLAHESTQTELGHARKVTLELKAQAFGADAETLVRQALGSEMEWQGFLANTRNGKGLVFHIQAFKHT